MSKDTNIADEQLIAFLLGELNEEQELMVKNALVNNAKLQEKERIFADTLRLVEQSCNETIPSIPGNDLKLSDSRKREIFPNKVPESNDTQVESNDNVSERKQPINFLFWIPLGVAACAFLVVLISGPKKQSQLEIAVQNRSESESSFHEAKQDLEKKEELVLSVDTEIKLLLNDQAQRGMNRELIARTTDEVLAMNEELKKAPSTVEDFAMKESLPIPLNSLAFTQSENQIDNLSAQRLGRSKTTKSNHYQPVPSAEIKSTKIAQEGQTMDVPIARIGISESSPKPAIDSTIDTNRIPEIENPIKNEDLPFSTTEHNGSDIGRDIQKKSLAAVMTQQDTEVNLAAESINSKLGVLIKENSSTTKSRKLKYDSSLNQKAYAFSTALPNLVTENKQSESEVKKNGYEQIDSSQSVQLFTPKAKALGKIKIVQRSNQIIELFRLHETRLGQSVLLSGEDYQLRFSSESEPVIILVGSLNKKLDAKEDSRNLNELSTYLFEIKEAWVLNEKEIRKPFDLNATR